ncbi:MAG: alanine dehydrogenase [Armatimonadota bacterium]|nr:alanine dehydrogenase [Armatimonadota bacterium]MDR7434626.1 alanine dehydrogenase [Armatimonadota bacterium]
MDISVPRETTREETRVPLSPAAVRALVQRGHRVFVERRAGEFAGFTDDAYTSAGATVVYSAEEAFRRGELVVKVQAPSPSELAHLEKGQMVMAFWHFPILPSASLERVLAGEITAIAYELMQSSNGTLPVLRAMSQIGGRLAIQRAAILLETIQGGAGVLLGGIPGIPPAEVVILGGGTVAQNAAMAALGLGAHVTIIEKDLERLQLLEQRFPAGVTTMVSNEETIRKAVTYANVLIGAVLVPGERTPILVTREMVRSMRPRSVIIDLSIDQGGCVETSRPTTLRDPVYVEEGIIHCCVPNLPAAVSRTASRALSNAIHPIIEELAEKGFSQAVRTNPLLESAVCSYRGHLTHPTVSRSLGRTWTPLTSLL